MPAWLVRTAGLLAASLAFMAVSGWLYLPWWELAFRSDNSPVSWLSSALLVADAALALRLAGDGGLPRAVGLVLAVVLFTLALDEQFMFHERIKHRWLPKASPWADWNTQLIALAALPFVAWFWRAVPSWTARALMIAAVAVGEFALLVDLATGSMPPLVAQLEEGFEVLAETLFLAALLALPPRAQVQSSSSSA